MSYDVYVGGEGHNYTSNLRAFFIDFHVYPPDWKGRPRAEVAAEIEAGLAMIRSNDLPTLRAEYNPPNGWGSVDSAIEWLSEVRVSCLRELPEMVGVSW